MRIFVLAALCWSTTAVAGTYDIHMGDDLYGRLQMLQPGDEVIVHAGTYMTPGFLQVTWAGTASQPIVIHAAPGDRPIIVGTFAQNTINIAGSYWTLQGFEITGGSHGLRLMSVDHATIQDNVIHGTGDVGISCNFEPNNCDSLQIIHNEIYDTGKDGGTGEGMYLGCNNAACTFTNSLVALNYVHDMGGTQGDGIEIKEGAHDNIVRDNVIVRPNYPGITMYGFAGAGGPNIVERNLVWHGKADNGIQIVGQIIVRNNLVLDTAITGIASKPSQNATPHDAVIVNNTVAGAGTGCLKTNNWSTEPGNVIANNALYCDGASAADITGGAAADVVIVGNIGLGTSNAPAGFTMGTTTAADIGDPATGNVYPPPASILLNAGDMAHQPVDDFNGLARVLRTVGAYDGASPTNPGWTVMEGFKTPPPATPDSPTGDDPAGEASPSHSGCGCEGSDDPSALLLLASWLTWSSGRWTRRFRRRRPSPSRQNPR